MKIGLTLSFQSYQHRVNPTWESEYDVKAVQFMNELHRSLFLENLEQNLLNLSSLLAAARNIC